MTEATGSVRLWIQDPATGVSCPPRVLMTVWFSIVPEMPGVRPQLPNAYGLQFAPGVDPFFGLMSHWIMICLQQHGACSKNGKASRLPTRVIDVGHQGGDPFLYTPHPIK